MTDPGLPFPLVVRHYPDPILRRAMPEITLFDTDLAWQAAQMLDLLYSHQGGTIGLAANQVGYPGRLLVVDLDIKNHTPHVLVNPKIVSGDTPALSEEGCVSLPGITAQISRFSRITVQYQDLFGAPLVMEATDLLAFCIQHEIDHLDGKLFVDHLSALKRTRLLAQCLKHQRLKEH